MKKIMRFFGRVFTYLFISQQNGWWSVLLHDMAVIFLFLAIFQLLPTAGIASIFLGTAKQSTSEVLREVRMAEGFFATLIGLVYFAVLLLRAKDRWLPPAEIRNESDVRRQM